MSTSPTKSQRVRLGSALRDGFRERGWGRKSVGFSVDVPPPGWVHGPLEAYVSREVAAAKYGGVSLYASATIYAPQVTAIFSQLPAGCLDSVGERAAVQQRELPRLASVDFDDLKTSDWTAIQEDQLDEEGARFFAVLDGPFRAWATERSTPERLLAVQTAPGAPQTQTCDLVRTMAILALQADLPEVARRLVSDYVPAGRADTEERFSWFERELAKHLPTYGTPVRS